MLIRQNANKSAKIAPYNNMHAQRLGYSQILQGKSVIRALPAVATTENTLKAVIHSSLMNFVILITYLLDNELIL